MAQLLLERGADVSAASTTGETPLKVAYGEQVRQLLRQHVAEG